MEVQLAQVQPLDSSLLQNRSAQNQTDASFNKYLEDEQKRLAFVFGSMGQFDFGSFFSYPALFSDSRSGGRSVSLFDGEPAPKNDYAEFKQAQNQTPQDSGRIFVQAQESMPKLPESTLFELLSKTGWLVPNLEANPLLFNAQLDGKLLSKLDLQALIDQIVSQVKLVTEKGKSELLLGLKPDELGEILLTLTSKAGMVSIKIEASDDTRKLLETLRHDLEQALKRSNVSLAGLKIERIKEENKNA